MRLKDKLARLAQPAAQAGALAQELVVREEVVRSFDDDDAARLERIARLRSMIGEVADRARHTGEPIAARAVGTTRKGRQQAALPVGALRDTPDGPLHVVETFLPPDHCHGRVAVRGALTVDAALVAKLALDPKLEAVDLTRMLLLDTETTGLAGGTGTVRSNRHGLLPRRRAQSGAAVLTPAGAGAADARVSCGADGAGELHRLVQW